MAEASATKISLPAFLKMLTNHNIPPSRAMTVAGKIYKTHNTAEQLSMLTDFSLESAGITEKDLRKQVLAAVRKAGYKGKPSTSSAAASTSRGASSAGKASSSKADSKPQRKRKRDDDLNELLPSKPREEGDSYGSLEFNEILDEEVCLLRLLQRLEAIKTKYAVVNRAPIMMAWAFVVAERLGFRREEALSIASVYTEMNAVTKGVSLGIYRDGKQRGMDASRTGSQPQELTQTSVLGTTKHHWVPATRSLPTETECALPSYVYAFIQHPASHTTSFPFLSSPLYQTASSQWRALSSGSPVAPTSAFSYITRALRQTAPHIVGALRLLAESYSPAELNEKGFSLYADFRPASEGWGQKAEVRCSAILELRKPRGEGQDDATQKGPLNAVNLVKVESGDPESLQDPTEHPSPDESPAAKKAKRESPDKDEYDAALDDDALFTDFDLNSIP
ncbi:hypothetical protein OH77DRAFT_1522500 [Trametes cingulata]|nr:hypothetical protein OH77DRAFT_1522500 [Trametes cingulata]